MKLSERAAKELLELGNSEEIRHDLGLLNMRHKFPFISSDVIDVDAYVQFVQRFNEFINHEPKPFRPMVERDMKL